MNQPAKTPRLIKVLIGQVSLTRAPNRLESVLGSCIGLVVYDEISGIAGMAHVLLPDSAGRAAGKLPGKYADRALPCLITGLLKHGANRSGLKAKIAGGARMFQNAMDYQTGDVGSGNVAAVRAALKEANIPIVSAEVGGTAGRKATFDVASFHLTVEDFAKRRVVI